MKKTIEVTEHELNIIMYDVSKAWVKNKEKIIEHERAQLKGGGTLGDIGKIILEKDMKVSLALLERLEKL